ncbi:MAG: hypothetical protein LUI07_07160 [Lachnospiraceae bacterium]|nr:hypothetical protein [Lachnospiraceae bacterium]
MKTGKFLKRFFGTMALCLMLAVVLPQAAALRAQAETKTTSTATVKNGWNGRKYYKNGVALTGRRTIDGKVYYFDKNGRVVTGWKKINGKVYYFSRKSGVGNYGAACTGKKKINSRYYYFSQKGILKTGWKTIDGKRYYFRTSGKMGTTLGAALTKGVHTVDGAVYYFTGGGYVKTGWWYKTSDGEKYYYNSRGVRVTGIQKISGNYYFFRSSGRLLTESKKIDGINYYLDSNGYLEAYSDGSVYYKPNGTKMTDLETEDYKTLLRARAVIAEVTTSNMTKAQKLKACFDWVISKPYKIRRKFSPADGWIITYANDHFIRGGGDCHADGSAFAYLAKALGYTEVYVCLDSNGITSQGHCWTEINGKVYDPLFSEAKNYSKYYGCSYSTYGLRAILHIKMS